MLKLGKDTSLSTKKARWISGFSERILPRKLDPQKTDVITFRIAQTFWEVLSEILCQSHLSLLQFFRHVLPLLGM